MSCRTNNGRRLLASGGVRWTDGRPQHRGHRSLAVYPILILVSGLAVAIAAAAQFQQQQQQQFLGVGFIGRGQFVENQTAYIVPAVDGQQQQHQLPSLQREGRQAPAAPTMEGSSSSRIVPGDANMLLDPYPLSGFDDIDFDDAGIGPISLGGHLDELEMSRRRGSQTTTSTTTPVDDSESAFSGALETNVTASLGQTAFLRCRLKNSQHQVTWIRIRDWHILTSGLLTYTADARFRVKHLDEASEWTLEIKFLQKRDEGTYYCQIPTRTGAVVHAFHLHVASPQAVILGGQVSHVDILTPSLTLVCIVDNTPDPPQVIFWYHNGTMLKDGKYPETSDGSVGSGLISSHLTLTPSRTMSMLTLHHIQHIHSGNYTCRAPNAEPDTTQLFVTQRHEQAAVHRSSSSRRNTGSWSIFLIAALIGHVLTVRRKVLVDNR